MQNGQRCLRQAAAAVPPRRDGAAPHTAAGGDTPCARFRHLPPPIILIGMHRSGTSLVAGMLHALGVYMGPDLRFPAPSDPPEVQEALRRAGYGEALPFREINESLLKSARAEWDRVTPFLQARGRAEDPYGERLLRALEGRSGEEFLAGRPEGWRGAWGWKDPRTSLTLPYWLKAFPQARLIHVRRDPEAVARSLARRAAAQAPPRRDGTPLPPAQRLRWWLQNPGLTARRLAWRLGLVPAETAAERQRCEDPAVSKELWRLYVAECERYRAHPGGYLELDYEAIAGDPLGTAKTLARFGAIPATPDQLTAAASLVQAV
ncbi:MAG: sulfotransferase [Armatimonadota bacterium]